jgi:N6-adenosine-specific RNA methylase IME4
MRDGPGTILIDPPWRYGDRGAASPPRARPYPTLSIDEIAALPIAALDLDYLFIWTTGQFCEPAYGLLRSWGFEFASKVYWVKVARLLTDPFTGKFVYQPSYGFGHWFRPPVEECLVGCRPGARKIHSHDLGLISPNARHSRKPESLHRLIEDHYPPPYVELFARRPRRGWICLGDELDGQDVTASIAVYRRTGKAPLSRYRRKGFFND